MDISQTIISQYATSPTIVRLVNDFAEYIDPASDLQAFFDYVWNVETAQGFGLDAWGKIVDVGRNLLIPGDETFWGFDEGVDFFPFDEGIFYYGTPSSQTYVLDDTVFRKLVLFKAALNISDLSIPAINQQLLRFFNDRRCYCQDLGGMEMAMVFEFELEPWELAIVRDSTAIPRPAGVKITIIQFVEDFFGFSEAGDFFPFDDGIFY